MEFKILLKGQLYVLRELIIISIFYSGIICFLFFKVEFDLFKILFLSTFLFYFIVFFSPVLTLHINYLNNSKYKSVIIQENKLTIDKDVFLDCDIDRINIFATSQHFNDSVGASALPYNDYYYYVEICLKNGEKVNLTSLLNYKIDRIIIENFKSININEKKSTLVMLFVK